MPEWITAIEEQAMNGDTHACGELLNTLIPVREAIETELRSVLNAG